MKMTEEQKRKISIGVKNNLPSTAFKKGHKITKEEIDRRKIIRGEKHWLWKGGRTSEQKRQRQQASRANKIYPGKIDINIIQIVYEDNIKKYGTLTCYICIKPISFGKDTLEHKVLRKDGGTNNYNNLEISCRSCNSKKRSKSILS